jgi:predicted aminopeptidase
MRSLLLSLLALIFVTGCVGPSYYMQSIHGHFDLLSRRRSIQELLDREDTSDLLKIQLRKTGSIRRFSQEVLLLPTQGTFTQYANLERSYATWMVFATPPYSLQPKTWCFPVAGCLAYLGFFHKEEAQAYSAKLKQQGFDVYLSGSPAYSTLGWFDDPLLNTFMGWPEDRLAALMFHEMAHQKLYISGDSTFNESFAEAVSQIGVRLWFEGSGEYEKLENYNRTLIEKKQFIEKVKKVRAQLKALYAAPLKEKERQVKKQEILAKAVAHNPAGYGHNWFAKGLNNAKLNSINTYNHLVPEFLRVYDQVDRDLERFYHILEKRSNNF